MMYKIYKIYKKFNYKKHIFRKCDTVSNQCQSALTLRNLGFTDRMITENAYHP